MRKVVLCLGLVLIAAAAALIFQASYMIGYLNMHEPLNLLPEAGAVAVLEASAKRLFPYEVRREASRYIGAAGVVVVVLAYTPWLWRGKEDK